MYYRKLRIYRTVLLTLMLLAGICSQLQAQDKRDRYVRIGIFTFNPINFINDFGDPDGLYPSLIDEMIRESKWKVSYVPGTFSEGMDRLQSGEIDLMLSVAWSESRAEVMDFSSESVVDLWGQVYISPGSSIQNINDLQDTVVAVMKDDITGQNLIKTAESLGISFSVMEYNDFFEAMEAVENGNAQAVAAPQHFGLRHLSEYDLVGSNILFSPFSIYFAVKKNENQDLIQEINKYLSEWKKDKNSVYYDSVNYWMTNEDLRREVIPLWVKILILLSLFVILIILVTGRYVRNTLTGKIEVIKKTEYRYRSLIQKLQAIVLRVTPEGSITLINDYTLDLLRQKRKSIIGINIFDLGILPEELSAHNINAPRTLKQMKMTSKICHGDSEKYFQWYINGIHSEENDDLICIGINVTDRIKVESALKESDERFISFMANIPAFAYIKNERGEHIYSNPATMSLLEEPVDRPKVEDFIENKATIGKIKEAEFRILNEGSEKETIEYDTHFPSDQKTRRIHEIQFPIHLTGGELWIGGFALDVTESRAIEEQLNQSRKMEAIGELAGGIAHDFNNQLAGIMGYADLLSHGVTNERMEKYSIKLKTAVERASEVTRQLLSFSRKGRKESRTIDINELIEDLISLLSHSINKQIHLHFDEKAGKPLIIGDPNLIQNALLNISINARDAMDNKGELYFTTQNIYVDEKMSALQGYVLNPGPYIKVSVEDTGSGMPKEIEAKIFEPFFTTKDEGKGTGMGLSMVYGTMQEHKGNITVQSTENKGTVFSLYFPKEEKIIPEEPVNVDMVDENSRYNIAVVDDESMIREFLNISLKEKGHKLRLFEDGKHFIESLTENAESYDIIILDMIMPEMSGIECYRNIMAIRGDIKVLLSSGYSKKEEVQEIMANPNVMYLQKPYSIRDLEKAIHNLMAGNSEN